MAEMSKKEKQSLSERDICSKFITPALEGAGWTEDHHVREEVSFTDGRIIVRGKVTARGKQKRADYVLYYRSNLPIAIIEAKDNNHSMGSGMQQALDYARSLDIPFVYSSNGDGFLEHDRTGQSDVLERELAPDQFPSPEELWERYCKWKSLTREEEQIVTTEYHSDGTDKEPRYYQRIAINRVTEAIAKGTNRILLVMATGTGKTYTAFQIIWRLWKARQKKRVLFLADRNVLVDQTKTKDFKPFGTIMTKITHRKVDKSFEIYLALYQQLTGPVAKDKVYQDFTPDFFDLIVIDECHRGSAEEDSAWREILEYFSSATQIGLTATPKETKYASNIHYFGEPLYTYSLKQGIQDGFLAPYKVVRIDIDKDLSGWRPEKSKKDRYGEVIEDRIYNQKDFDRSLVLDERTKLVAKKVTEFLKDTDRFSRSIVFCEDIDHAERMRSALINENQDLFTENELYILRITGDNKEGKDQLEYFQTPDRTYPVIVTTSRLLSTGVDVPDCKLIVLDRIIGSMTEFKQIIGRGTRLAEEYGKSYFTIMDFKKATELFADPDFDGEPVQIYEPGEKDSPVPPDVDEGPEQNPDSPEEEWGEDQDPNDELDPEAGKDFEDGEGSGEWNTGKGSGKRVKYYVHDVKVWVVGERIQYYDQDGKLITESLKDYTRKQVKGQYSSLDDFLRKWSSEEKKQAILDELAEQGVLIDALAEEVGRDYEAFDLICHVAFGAKPLTRRERAQNVQKKDYFAKYGEQARAVLQALLEKYADRGITEIEGMNVLYLDPLNELGTPVELIQAFGGKEQYLQALKELEEHLYESA